jgi:hypothetical protein
MKELKFDGPDGLWVDFMLVAKRKKQRTWEQILIVFGVDGRTYIGAKGP